MCRAAVGDRKTSRAPQWALDITRQDTQWRCGRRTRANSGTARGVADDHHDASARRFEQTDTLQLLIPTTPGPALSPTLSAFDPATRTFCLAVGFQGNNGLLWTTTIANDVNSSTAPVQVEFDYPAGGPENNTMVGLELWNHKGTLKALVIFLDGSVFVVEGTFG